MNHPHTSTVLVAGATGRTGSELLRKLDDTSLHVRAMTRSAANHESLVTNGADEVMVGDLLDPAAARVAVENCDAVLFAAGSNLATGLLRPGRVVDGTGVINLVEAATAEGVRTFVLQSTIGVGDSRPGMPLWARSVVLRWTVREKARAERALRESGLEHVVFRPGWLTDESATHDVLIAEGGGNMTGSIPRADVARLMVAALFTPTVANRSLEVVAKDDVANANPRSLITVEWDRAGAASVEGNVDPNRGT
ncbi:SDR family oxidoreductase [Natronorubrum halophilum]|uniref:SDR family oxidoreductase n=1 Tax=Natronorubrum halophilum TaxID=1702106 RepID=UPI000EF6611C|nr:SDR family oxidoreductase [Natronorubrum halophilum]